MKTHTWKNVERKKAIALVEECSQLNLRIDVDMIGPVTSWDNPMEEPRTVDAHSVIVSGPDQDKIIIQPDEGGDIWIVADDSLATLVRDNGISR